MTDEKHDFMNQQLRQAAGIAPPPIEGEDEDKPQSFDGGARDDSPAIKTDADKINEQIRKHISRRRGTAGI